MWCHRWSCRLLAMTLAVASLSGACSRDNEGAAASGARWEQKENWQQIRPGMSMEQVRGILGEPTATTTDPAFTQWTYGSGPKSGRVTFAGGMIRDWTSPK